MRSHLLFALIVVLITGLSGQAVAQDDDPATLVKGWLTEKGLTYTTLETGEIVIGFVGENASRIDVEVNFSDEFIHFATPIDYLPEKPGDGFYLGIITLTGPVPMIKPIIDEEQLFYLAIDLPISAMSLEEVISDVALLVEFTDKNYAELRPWAEE